MSETAKHANTANAFPMFGSTSGLSKMFLMGPHMQATMMALALERERETLGFLERRCQADLALAHQISGAKSVTDVFTAYANHVRSAFADYSAQARSFAEHGAQDALDAVRVAQEEAAKYATPAMRAAA